MLCPPAPLPTHVPEATRACLPEQTGRRFSGNASGADVYRVGEGDDSVFLKIHLERCNPRPHGLAVESDRIRWLSTVIDDIAPLLPNVLSYEQTTDHPAVGTWAYLVTSSVPGKALHHEMKETPIRVARLFGRALRWLHDRAQGDGLPPRTIDKLLEEAHHRLGSGMVGSSYRSAWSERSLKKSLAKLTKRPLANDAVVVSHFDFCLPNVLAGLDDRVGLIDVGGLSLADRHLDLATGIRSLRHNGGRDDAVKVFLRSYGQDLVDEVRLKYFTQLCEFL